MPNTRNQAFLGAIYNFDLLNPYPLTAIQESLGVLYKYKKSSCTFLGALQS